MHLRASQRLNLRTILELYRLDEEDFTWQDPATLPVPPNSFTSEGTGLLHTSTGAFFAIGSPWVICYGPFEAEKRSEVHNAQTWQKVTDEFTLWAESVASEAAQPLLWAESTASQVTLQLLQRRQLAQLYRIVEQVGFVNSPMLWSASRNSLSLRLQELGYRFTIVLQHPPLSPYNVSYTPGPVTNSATAERLTWGGVAHHFQLWADAVWEDLPAEQKLRVPKSLSIPEPVWLTRLELHRVRMFEHFVMELQSAPDSKLVLGTNGAGKSTLLRCLAIATSPQAVAQELLNRPAARIVGQFAGSEIQIHWQTASGESGKRKIFVVQDHSGNQVIDSIQGDEYPGLVVGYGSARGAQGSTERHISPALSLFDYALPLANPELVIRRLYDHASTGGFEQKFAAFRRMLELKESVQLPKPQDGSVQIRVNGDAPSLAFSLESWADGYRLTLAWYLDLFDAALSAKRLTDTGPQGLLLLDEVEQHLHPQLQARLLERLRTTFPDMQIVVTTHSPLVTLGAEPDTVLVLKREGSAGVTSTTPPDFSGSSVEEVIEDPELFATDPFPPKLREMIERQQELLELSQRSAEEEAELSQLNQQLWDLLPPERPV